MAGEAKMDTGVTFVRKVVPRTRRERALVGVIVVGVLVGGGLRFVSTEDAAGAAGETPAATACAAQ
jgi:hypothetical protein